jgi:hypothetical protein
LTNQPDRPQPDHQPDPAAPPPFTPDGTSAPGPAPANAGPSTPPSAPPAGSGPPSYTPGQAAIPQPDYPPTAQFPTVPMSKPAGPMHGDPMRSGVSNQPPVNYAPRGYTPDFGHRQGGYPPPDPYGQPPVPPGPGYGPPPGPGYGPPPPPRRSNAPLIAVILAVALLLCGGVATAGVMIFRTVKEKAQEATGPLTQLPTKVPDLPTLPTTVPDVPEGTGHKITVTYEVTGDGPAGIFYVEKLGSAPVRLDNERLPWKFTAEMETPTLLSVVAIRADNTEGSISCRVQVDGAEVKQNQSGQSNFATTTCTYFALD